VVLIGVGTHKENGEITGDYNIEDIKKVASMWTPTPGGVGPLNLSYLFQNLVTAAEIQNKA
jgi:methylenetetrahydrofolate dehydrogenase (NADP+)/methenyltetrahydrofolate cyclohydrolase